MGRTGRKGSEGARTLADQLSRCLFLHVLCSAFHHDNHQNHPPLIFIDDPVKRTLANPIPLLGRKASHNPADRGSFINYLTALDDTNGHFFWGLNEVF